MTEEELKGHLADLQQSVQSAHALLLQLIGRQRATEMILAGRLADCAKLDRDGLIAEIDREAAVLHDRMLRQLEDRNPRAAALLDRRDIEELPETDEHPS